MVCCCGGEANTRGEACHACVEVILAVSCCGLVIASNGRTGVCAECSVVVGIMCDCFTCFAIEICGWTALFSFVCKLRLRVALV